MRLLRSFFALIAEGFFILLPLIIAYLMIGQFFDLLLVVTSPVTDLLPGEWFYDEFEEHSAAALVMVGLFLLVGLLAKTRPAHRLGSWIERSLFERFPPYTVLKSLSQRVGGSEDAEKLQPALLTVGPDTRILVAIVEELPDDQLTVFVPLAPMPTLGMLQLVSAANVERLESSMTDALGWLLNWGAGTEALFRRRAASGQASPAPVAGGRGPT